jgi:hypothetical protein
MAATPDFTAGETTTVSPGSKVAQINWDLYQAYVQWTEVRVVSNEGDTPVIRLEDCLILGASGGGVFLNGVPIAINWSPSPCCQKATILDIGIVDAFLSNCLICPVT